MIPLSEISRLNHALPLRERQTAMSLVACHAAHFEYRSPKDFCDDYGLSVTKIAHGDPDALARLAALTGADLGKLQMWSPIRGLNNYFTVNGEMLGSVKSPRTTLRGCPLCIEEQIAASPDLPLDVATYQRAEDLIGYVRACPTHQVGIVTVRAHKTTTEYSDPVRNSGDLLDLIREQEVSPLAPTTFEIYCLDRVLGRPKELSPLDNAPLVAVGITCRALGTDILRGRSRMSIAEADLDRAYFEAGFSALKGGDATLIPVLTKLRDAQWLKHDLSAKAIPSTIKNVRLAFDTGGVGLLANLVAQAAFRVFPYGEGDELLDVRCNKRHLHTPASFARAYPMAPRVSELFVERTPGLVAAGSFSEGKVLIDADKADSLFADRVPLISMKRVCRTTGAKWEFVRDLIDASLLHEETDHQLRDHPMIFSLPRITADLEALATNWQSVEIIDPERVPLHVAANKLRAGLVHFFKFLLNGQISVQRVKDAPLLSIFVNLDEAYLAFYGSSSTLSAVEAGALLRVSKDCLRRLVDVGHLTNLSPIAERHGCRPGYRVDRREVDDFLARYASLMQIGEAIGSPGLNAFGAIRLGLQPEIDMAELGRPNITSTFYKRSDVRELLGIL